MYIPQIIEAIKIAKTKGLKLPIVYNSSGYESVDALKLLDGFVDKGNSFENKPSRS